MNHLTPGQVESFAHQLPNRGGGAVYWLGRIGHEPSILLVEQPTRGPATDLVLQFNNVRIRLATGAAEDIATRKAELESLLAFNRDLTPAI